MGPGASLRTLESPDTLPKIAEFLHSVGGSYNSVTGLFHANGKEKHMNVTYQTEQITPTITRILLPGQVFAYLVKGTERAALIDTGLGVGDLRAYVESLLDGMPYEVILTHGHLDHAAGADPYTAGGMPAKAHDLQRLPAQVEGLSVFQLQPALCL